MPKSCTVSANCNKWKVVRRTEEVDLPRETPIERMQGSLHAFLLKEIEKQTISNSLLIMDISYNY